MSPEFETNRKESIVVEDFEDNFEENKINVFSSNSRLKPFPSKQLSKVEPKK